MQKGFITLFSVILLTSLAVALVAMLATQSLLATKGSGDEASAAKARAAASACAEIALQNMKDNNGFTGSSAQAINGGSCGFIVSNLGGNSREITATGTVSGFASRLIIATDAFIPKINIVSWQEAQ